MHSVTFSMALIEVPLRHSERCGPLALLPVLRHVECASKKPVTVWRRHSMTELRGHVNSIWVISGKTDSANGGCNTIRDILY